MAVESVDSSVYVSKILSERRKVSFLILNIKISVSCLKFVIELRNLQESFSNLLLKVSFFYAGEKTPDGKNAPSKN